MVSYLESFNSAENLSVSLKEHEKYGLGSAIGNKACHLFTKNYISVFNLNKNESTGWTNISYEVPFDSNAGRVLLRTGFLLKQGELKFYEGNKVIQKGKAKGGNNYLRVTEIRGLKTSKINRKDEIFSDYVNLTKYYLKTSKGTPKKVDIQHIPNLILYQLNKDVDNNYSVADFDDGLIYIGTNYCLNHNNPDCEQCPINELCIGYNYFDKLIKDYNT